MNPWFVAHHNQSHTSAVFSHRCLPHPPWQNLLDVSTRCDQILKATAVQLQVRTRQCMTFTIPSAVLPCLTPGKRNRGSLETFESAYVHPHIASEDRPTSTQLNSVITSLSPLNPDFNPITTFLFTWCPSTSSLTYVCTSCMFIPFAICSNPCAGFWIKLLFISPFCQLPKLCLRVSPTEHISLYTLPCSLTAVKFSAQLLAPKRPTWLSATACLYLHSLSKKQNFIIISWPILMLWPDNRFSS